MDNNNGLPKGIFYKAPHEKAPDFVKGSINIKKQEFFEWMKAQPPGEWINLDMKTAKETGKIYLSVNDWKPNQQGQQSQPQQAQSPFSSSSAQPQQQQPPQNQNSGFDNKLDFDNPSGDSIPF